MSSTSRPNIHLYTTQTPNGIKISITLEELGLPYEFTKIDIMKNTQKEDWFLKINPNGRIPALTDTFSDGKTINLFESGSIQQYLVDEYDKDHKISYPKGTREYYEVNSWLFFLNSGLGPMQGQANHFNRYAPTYIEYGAKRYTNETRRLYSVLDAHLAKSSSGFIVGDKLTIADIAHWGWVRAAFWAGVEIDEFPALKKWEAKLLARPGFDKGRQVPGPDTTQELKSDPEAMKKKAAEASAWIQAAVKDEASKK
ncbi:related to URE2-nitrogen catabolite repression regulator [Rhynchosporium secalis]|uniref:Related to URE2-nitrogen catabolite repression regulator n=1 Tax=Rhynchosporium secalis TaxID=38038 RepID=A0A1E1MJW9_RHYSE|nr:related to URE2-nitrogen catabolite repression regulator [Rhynchosporium secalis]